MTERNKAGKFKLVHRVEGVWLAFALPLIVITESSRSTASPASVRPSAAAPGSFNPLFLPSFLLSFLHRRPLFHLSPFCLARRSEVDFKPHSSLILGKRSLGDVYVRDSSQGIQYKCRDELSFNGNDKSVNTTEQRAPLDIKGEHLL